jgi:hypothetical protein
MAIKFNVIVEVNVDKDVVDEYDKIDSDYGETISAIIQDSFKRNIYTTRTKVYRHNMFERLNENAEDYLIRDAREEIENEILTQHCIGGSCED